MIRITELSLPLDHPGDALRKAIVRRLGIADTDLLEFSVFRRGYDARRKGAIAFVYTIDLQVRDEASVLSRLRQDRHVGPAPDTRYRYVARAPEGLQERPVIVGFGPCGLFAALVLAQTGFRPIVLERGRDVRRRTQDTWALWRRNTLTPESNVQFGEGGAGLFSDGKLYSQIKDPKFLGRKVMEEFVRAGAPPEILYVSKPHIGTFRLTRVVSAMRSEIIALGGEVRFESKVTDLLVEAGRVEGVVLEDGSELRSRHVVLALGHSSRDTFRMLQRRGVHMEAKPFSLGFRIEHPQSMIDRARLGPRAGHPALGAADYKLVHHASNGRTVYSFCMCPGGTVVAATSEPGRVVTNGMSQYSRNERNANAGMVVGIDPADFPLQFPQDTPLWLAAFGEADGTRYAAEAEAQKAKGQTHPLAGIVLQRQLEARAYTLGGGTYEAPGQLVGDFIAGRPSTALAEVEPSYKPGVKLGDLAPALPAYAIEAMREALPVFGRKIKGYDMPGAVLTGVETRTSAPLRITRGSDLQSLNTRGLYPAGEGAGYAGGILSAGVDGLKVAEALARDIFGLTAPT